MHCREGPNPVTRGANQNQFGDCPETTLETRLQLRPLFLSAFYPSAPLSLELIDRVPTLWQWRIWSILKVRRGGRRYRIECCIVYTSGCAVGHLTPPPRENTHTCCLPATATAHGELIRAYRLLVVGCLTDGPMVCLLYTSPSPRDKRQSRMPSSA